MYEEGIETNKRVVAELMAKNNLRSTSYKRKQNSKKNKVEEALRTNELKRAFNQEHINKVWCGDITYVICADGTLYVSSYTDLGSRMDVSFDIRSNMKEDLVIDSLKKTFDSGRVPEMIHTDGEANIEVINLKH